MTQTSPEFANFKEFVRKIVSVPKSEIDAVREQEERERKTRKKQLAKVKP